MTSFSPEIGQDGCTNSRLISWFLKLLWWKKYSCVKDGPENNNDIIEYFSLRNSLLVGAKFWMNVSEIADSLIKKNICLII